MQIYGVASSPSAAQKPSESKAQDVLDKHDFLRLLTVQLRYQDPIDPIKDQDFIAQLAQFTSLEQMQNLTDKMGEYIHMQSTVSATSQAASLLGRTVLVFDPETESTVEGTVESVRFDFGVPLLTVAGKAYTLSDVYEIRA